MGEAMILLIASVLTAGVAIHAMITITRAAKTTKSSSDSVSPPVSQPGAESQAPY